MIVNNTYDTVRSFIRSVFKRGNTQSTRNIQMNIVGVL